MKTIVLPDGEILVMERFIYPYLVYSANPTTLYPKNIPVGYIYTLGAPEEYLHVFRFSKGY